MKTTELVFIIDRSGSMSGLECDTVGGFNSLIRKQKEEEGEALVSMVLFNDESKVVYDRADISDIEELGLSQYTPCGCTALLDAVGGAIHHIGNVHKYARAEDRPEKTLFVITTDGMENASTRYTQEKVKAMIERQQERYGWEFLFLGANIDAAKSARDIGIREEQAVEYICDDKGTGILYDTVNFAVSNIRAHGIIDGSWKDAIAKDTKARKKNNLRRG